MDIENFCEALESNYFFVSLPSEKTFFDINH